MSYDRLRRSFESCLLILPYFFPLLFSFFGERKNFPLLLATHSAAFLSYFILLTRSNAIFTERTSSAPLPSFRFWIGFGLTIRVAFLFSPPLLSEDVYRFLWDGLLSGENISPFSRMPSEVGIADLSPEKREIANSLLVAMNSPGFYSVYPPVLQFLFYVSSQFLLLFGDVNSGILVWKLFLLLSEVVLQFVLVKTLKKHGFPVRRSWIYWLNPLVLSEISGNAHPESILVLFCVLSVLSFWNWTSSNDKKDGILHFLFLGSGILTKITPAAFLPFFAFRILRGENRKTSVIRFFLYVLPWIAIVFGFLFFPETIRKQNRSGLGVFFQLFEFNGSVYYVLREFLRVIGEDFYAAGKYCAALSGISISVYSLLKRKTTAIGDLFGAAETVYCIFLIFSTTVHPWYILPLLGFCVFSGRISPIVWSFIILVSYSTYSVVPFRDSFFWLGIEYGILFFFLHIDYKRSVSSTKTSENTLRTRP